MPQSQTPSCGPWGNYFAATLKHAKVMQVDARLG